MIYNNSDCINPCPSGTYQDGYFCFDCHPMCNNCSGPSEGQCSSCKTGGLFNSGCNDTCPSGYYQSGGICYGCASPCITCSSSHDCLSCISGMRYLNKRCYLLCPKGYYINGNDCSPCKEGCLTCSDGTLLSCDKCGNSTTGEIYYYKYFFNKTCSLTCP